MARHRHRTPPPGAFKVFSRQGDLAGSDACSLDGMGRIHWPKSGGKLGFKRCLCEMPGKQVQDVVRDIRPISAQSKESTKHPARKPLALLNRIIRASSNIGDIILDPF